MSNLDHVTLKSRLPFLVVPWTWNIVPPVPSPYSFLVMSVGINEYPGVRKLKGFARSSQASNRLFHSPFYASLSVVLLAFHSVVFFERISTWKVAFTARTNFSAVQASYSALASLVWALLFSAATFNQLDDQPIEVLLSSSWDPVIAFFLPSVTIWLRRFKNNQLVLGTENYFIKCTLRRQ